MPLMCNNNGVDSLEELASDCDQLLHQGDLVAMDHSNRTDSGGMDDVPRAKFLCSFGGCVLPRPQDGKLRYVGGETRIVSVPRNIGYEELMNRMREIYDETSILKYQQPDEDLDALVSVVNDDDVVNMMEEYDKLGSGDAFTRLRIFLFSPLDQDASPQYMDGDERDSERRYVDALNSLCESPDYRRQNPCDSPTMTPFDDIHIVDQYLNSMNLDGSVHNQRNYEMAMSPYNLSQLSSPSMAVGQHCLPMGQLHSEDVSWSPAGYSPRYAGPHEMRTYTEVGSPSYARFHMAYQEIGDRCVNRVTEEPTHQQTTSQLPLDCPQQYSDQVVWFPTGTVPVDMGGFPGNMHNGPNVVDCQSVCQHCKTNFPRTPSSSDFPRKPEEPSHVEQLAMRNGLSKVASTCVECHSITPISAVGRMGDQGTVDGNAVPSTYAFHEDPGHIRVGGELGGEVFHGQAMPNGSHVHIPLEERGVRPANLPYTQGADILPQLSHGNTSVWPNGRNVPAPVHVLPHDPCILPPRSGMSTGYPYGNLSQLSSPVPLQGTHQTISQDPLRNTPNMVHIPPSVEAPRSSGLPSVMLNDNPLSSDAGDCGQLCGQDGGSVDVISDKILEMDGVHPPKQNSQAEKTSNNACRNADKSNSENPGEESEGSNPKEEISCLPEQIDSAQGARIEGAEEIKGGSRENGGNVIAGNASREVATTVETESVDVKNDSAGGSENECTEPSKIGPSKAEEEAIAKGLQTIKNADLEEVRELGTGTYGAVYHGKWRGSDVAIKRIKASCFSGRPSEIERLIADFWKEALILSSLHHPNVVSFYGVVRDGPDGSLATVTEFMINGSLKQFLRKKDRTIDRRKRVIIAMDAAFGMEYLHEKNIVHFDLKCENLLVNMRDPHRPVCKIGDLGLSKVKQHTLVSGGVRGTLPWMAPELLSGKTHMVTEKIDVYSFGIVMWELLTGEEPYSDMHCASLIGGIVNNTLRPQIPTWCDPEWKALMESCWASEPAERPSFSEISQKLRSMAAAMNIK